MDHRDQLRRELRARRLALTRAERDRLARAIARQLARSHLFLASRRIAAYLPVRGEASPLPLIARALALGKQVYLPVLSPLHDGRLWFCAYHGHRPLARNRFGIPEPRPRDGGLLPATGLDLVLAPLVGFDARGNRLGMGGGFYDRTFAFRNARRHWHRPRLIGYAYAFQQVAHLAACHWDVPLDGVVTEQGLRLFEPR